ncbi:hypothetical protein UC8_50320 [Roseimaritima ulvae]|uniref:Uncharacterized protein n=1 Tax=Roseimaritima ulvae TaxID=980254 RepID=A0A5B9QYJ7_9BACT|nr:hypothetical protein UC8_50320 [Roseimaritima ulvae]
MGHKNFGYGNAVNTGVERLPKSQRALHINPGMTLWVVSVPAFVFSLVGTRCDQAALFVDDACKVATGRPSPGRCPLPGFAAARRRKHFCRHLRKAFPRR